LRLNCGRTPDRKSRQGRPKVAGGKSPEPRRGERKDDTAATHSFVPDGTRFIFASQPSDESLGYSRTSLRDIDSRHAKHVRVRSTSRSTLALPRPLRLATPAGAIEKVAVRRGRDIALRCPRRVQRRNSFDCQGCSDISFRPSTLILTQRRKDAETQLRRETPPASKPCTYMERWIYRGI